MENIGHVHNLITSTTPAHVRCYTPGPDGDFWPLCTAFYRRHRRAVLTINRFSGINTAAALFRASLPF